jgi:hypothetical protein
VGNSGRLLTSWDPSLFILEVVHIAGGILLTGRRIETNHELAFLNIYGPCQNIINFWKSIASNGILSISNLILEGDINIILAEEEAWEESGTIKNMDDFFKTLFQMNNLVDIKPTKLKPT